MLAATLSSNRAVFPFVCRSKWPDAASVATVTIDNRGSGAGNTKRKEIRFLILSGLPHAEIIRRAGTSDGTVSLIRKELRDAIPLYRNSVSGLSVPFACRDDKSCDQEISQPMKSLVGPAGFTAS
jgi:hypothetical protein